MNSSASPIVLFGTVVVLLVLALGIAWVIPAADGVGGHPHDVHMSMRQAGSGPDRHEGLLGVGWAFGMLSIFIFVLLIGFGCRRGDGFRGLARPLVAAFCVYVGVFTWMMVAYADYMVAPGGPLILGFPLPSAIMLYLLYPVTAILNLYFVVGYRRWVLTGDDEARYVELVERHKARAAGRTSG